ncbi:MAG TPA: hypothetical protein VGM93_03910 [Acidimicrobiales bacterium]|jgi:hypothetical protein
MGATVVRYKAKPDRADENQEYVEKVFAELATTAPEGLRYATFRLADGVSFVHVAFVDTPDGSNPLSSTPAFASFVAGIADRCDEPPVATEATVVGSYNF